MFTCLDAKVISMFKLFYRAELKIKYNYYNFIFIKKNVSKYYNNLNL